MYEGLCPTRGVAYGEDVVFSFAPTKDGILGVCKCEELFIVVVSPLPLYVLALSVFLLCWIVMCLSL